MNGSLIQLLVLAGIAIFLILKLRSVLGTRDGFAVLRDPIACKHAVMAETDDWVAMATEWRAIAHLPGAETAKTWEPEPEKVYTWGGHA